MIITSSALDEALYLLSSFGEFTVFTCSLRRYEWLVMPFGLKNTPSIFQRKMDEIFNKYRKFVCIYIDDILVHSKSREEHVGHLKLV